MDREEVHHKMSKKVAQLTKVIVHLNTRNDEADNHLSAMTDSYEQEIEQILREANSKVAQAAKIVDKSRGESATQQVDKLRRQYEEEKREGLSDLQTLRSSMSGREVKNNAMWTDRIKQMSAEMLSIRQQCTQQASQCKDALQAAEEQYSSRLAELTSQHKTEIASVAKACEEDLRVKMQAASDAEAARTVEMQRVFDEQLAGKSKQLSEQERRIESLEAELRECKSRLDASLLDGGAALQDANAARERFSSELQQARAEIARLEQVSAEKSVVVQQRDDEIVSLQNAFRQGDEERRGLEGEIDVLRKQLADSQSATSKLQGEFEALQARMKRERDALEGASGNQRAELEDRIHALEKRERELMADLEVSKASEAKLRGEEAYASQRVKTLEVEVEGLRADLAKLRDASAAESSDAMAKWQAEKQSLETALDKQKSLVQQLQRSIEELTAEMQRRLDASSSGSAQELEDQRAAHAAALEALKRKHAQELAEELSLLRNAHATELQDSKDKLTAEITALKEQLRQLELQLDSGNSGLQDKLREIDDLREKLRSREAELLDAQKARQDGLNRESELQSQKEALERELERLREEAEASRRQHEAELERLRNSLQGDASQESARHQQELDKLRRELEAKMDAKERDAAQVRARLEEQLKELQKRIDDLLAEHDSAHRNAGSELESLRAQMQRQIEEAKMEGVRMVQRLTADHQSTMTEVFAKHSDAITQLRETLSKSHQERIDELRQRHEVQFKEIKEKHEALMQDAAATHQTQTETMRSEHKASVASLEEAAKSAAARQAEELRLSEAALKKESEEHAKEKEHAQQLQGRLFEAQSLIDELNSRMRTAEMAHAEALNRKEEEFAKEKRNLKEQHKAETEQLLEVHLKETGQLKDQFDRARELQDMQIAMLQQRLQELQELYDSRPSRPEDLEHITALTIEVQEKDEMVKRLVEEMKFYKLELTNREQNYNKVFGASPTVGVMNPIAAKRNAQSGNAPSMRLVQQPGAGMNGMNMNLPPLGGMVSSNTLAGGNAPPTMPRKQSMEKRRPSSGSLPPRHV